MSIWEIVAQSGQRILQNATERLQLRLPTDPVPDQWHDILARNVPLARPLSPPDRDRLLQVARLLGQLQKARLALGQPSLQLVGFPGFHSPSRSPRVSERAK